MLIFASLVGTEHSVRGAPSTAQQIDTATRAYFAALVRGDGRAAYRLLATCSAITPVGPPAVKGSEGLPGRGPFYSAGSTPVFTAAAIYSVTLVANPLLWVTTSVEARVDGLFHFNPANRVEGRPDGRYLVPILFNRCGGGSWGVYALFGGGGTFHWTRD